MTTLSSKLLTAAIAGLMTVSGAIAVQAAPVESSSNSNNIITHPAIDCTDLSLKHTPEFAENCPHISRHAFLAPDQGSLSSAGGQSDVVHSNS